MKKGWGRTPAHRRHFAVGVSPRAGAGDYLGGVWWLFAIYIALAFGIIVAFFQMRVQLFKDRLVVRFGFIYRKTIDVSRIEDCVPSRWSTR